MSMVRLNITLPDELARQLEKVAGSRNKSSFIAEALKQRIKQMKEEELNKILKEGYKERKQESLLIAKDFEPVDLEAWDEY